MAHTRITSSKGFTLIEMLIVLAIIGMVTGIVVTSQHSFDRSVILTNTAYDIALSIREAQSYGFSGKSVSITTTNIGKYAYGVDFNMATPHTYTLFADNGGSTSALSSCHKSVIPLNSPDQKIGNCYFSKSSGDIVVKNFVINNGITISKVCVSLGNSNVFCSNGSNSGQLDISFTRPNSIFVRFNTHVGNTACITVSRLGAKRYILVRGYGTATPYESGTVSVSHTPVSPYCG